MVNKDFHLPMRTIMFCSLRRSRRSLLA